MNSDIRLSTGFFSHPKTVLLKRHLGWTGVEALLKLWCFSAQYNCKGVYEGHDPSYIEIAVGWRGKKGEFVKTIIELRWLDKTATGYVLHDWEDHNGYVIHADERKEKAKKASAARWSKDKQKGNSSNATSIPSSNAPSPNPSPNPNPTPLVEACSENATSMQTGTEKAIRKCVEERRSWLGEKFPGVDIDIEVEEMVAKYRDVGIGADTFLIVSRWFKNVKQGRQNGPDNYDVGELIREVVNASGSGAVPA